MSVIETSDIEYYYDTHEEEDMPESYPHVIVVTNLGDVLHHEYRVPDWLILSNQNIFFTRDRNERPLAPDIALIKGVRRDEIEELDLKSWHVAPPHRPPPVVVIEIASEHTAGRDQREKLAIYDAMGVFEYFCYDPRGDIRSEDARLNGWRREKSGILQRLEKDRWGRLWSEELQSWLVPEGRMLRLYDPFGVRRPTRAEAAEADAASERAALEVERAALESARERLEKEQAAREAAQAAFEAERDPREKEQAAREAAQAAFEAERDAREKEQAARETAQAALERARERLREMGIDPSEDS